MSRNLKEILQRDLTDAVRVSDAARKRTLRVVLAVIHSAEARDATVENPVARDLTDDEILAILGTEADRRRRAIAAYENAGHGHRASAERAELAILTAYLDDAGPADYDLTASE